MKLLRAALLYFVLIFAVGFVLGTIRVLFVVPRLGVRTAELLELPVMVTAAWAAARWIVRRSLASAVATETLLMGALALAFLLAAEIGFAVMLRGVTVRDALFARDPVSGPAYYASLLLFMLMPSLVRHGRTTPRRNS